MQHHSLLLNLLFIGLAACAPVENDVVITEEFFPESQVVYTADHDIISIVVPLNQLNFDSDSSSSEEDGNNSSSSAMLFFVLADIKDNGEKDYKGLYHLNDRKVKLLLENGTDATSAAGNGKKAYFSAKDGIYSYDADKKEAEKFGSVTDNLIRIAVENGTDILYVLNANHELYKVTDNGDKKTKLNDDVEDFLLDDSNNLYYYGKDKQTHVVTKDADKKIENLPASTSIIKLVRPSFNSHNSVIIIVDYLAYDVYANGTVVDKDYKYEVMPTAFAIDAALVQYYGHNKKIYEHNLLSMMLTNMADSLKKFFNGL